MNQRVVKSRLDQCGKPEIDQFASHIIKYTSYLPDPDAYHVKAISLFWLDHNSYIFSPFSIIERVLTKLAQGQATALVAANTVCLQTQPWFLQFAWLVKAGTIPLLVSAQQYLL